MRLDQQEESSNIEDRRGLRMPGGRAGGIGIGTIVLALVASYLFGIDPGTVIGIATQMQGAPTSQEAPAMRPPSGDAAAGFVAKVLGSTEQVWQQQFAADGHRYQEPHLVLYSGMTESACGMGQAAMGPFYCPADGKVYLDLDFFATLAERFGANGDFAQAYVIAHEIGHHVQNLLGISEQVQQARASAGTKQANALSVRLELQADCLAGVWAARADAARHILETGDIEEALAAASAIGDDRLQHQARGVVVPDAFTHGSSAQRVRWFRRGIDSGDLQQCNTFAAAQP